MKKQSRTDRFIFAGIIFLLIFAPLAFGSVHVWAYTLVQLGVFSLLMLWVLDRFIWSKNDAVELVKTPADIFLLLLLCWIALQLVPLPPAWVAFFSPKTHADKTQLFGLMARMGFSGGRWFPLAYYRHPVVVEGLKLLTYLGMFFLVLNTARSKKRIDLLIYALIFVGLFEVLYGIYQIFSETHRVWWWIHRGQRSGRATGTYIVANHFAGYLELVIPLIFGFVIAQRKRRRRIVSGLGGGRAGLQRVVGLFAPESASPRMIFLFFSATVLTLGLLFSGSRGAIVSSGIAMLGVSVLFFTKDRYRKYGVLAIVFCLLAFSYGIHIGIQKTMNRFDRFEDLDKRLFITRTIYPMVGEYAASGVGWGNFKYLYPRYTPDALNRVSSSGYAHNDWIEAFSELGFVGGGLIVAALMAFLIKMVRVWRNRRDLYALGVGAGVMAGAMAMSFHSYFDFNMHIPANPLTLAAVLAVGYAVLHRQGHGYSEKFFYRVRKIQPANALRMVIAGLLVAVFAASAYAAVRHFRAEVWCPTEWNSTLNLNWDPKDTDIQKAIAANPFNAEYYNKLAGYYERMATKYAAIGITSAVLDRQYRERAIAGLQTAVRLNPARENYWSDLGKHYSLRNDDAYAYVSKWLPLADDCYEQAVKNAPRDRNILFHVAWYWVWRSTLLPKQESGVSAGDEHVPVTRRQGIRKFQGLFQRSLALDPQWWQWAVERVWEFYPDDAVVLGIVPVTNEKLKSRVLKMVAMK